MRKYVFTVREDICLANDKDPNATDLLEVMKKYGSIEEYNAVFALATASYDATIAGLTARVAALEAYDLTADEIEMLNTYRMQTAKIVKEKDKQIEELTATIDTVYTTAQNLVDNAKAYSVNLCNILTTQLKPNK